MNITISVRTLLIDIRHEFANDFLTLEKFDKKRGCMKVIKSIQKTVKNSGIGYIGHKETIRESYQ